MSASDGWANNLEKDRQEKNRYLSADDKSPIPPEQRGGFRGLNYFPPNRDFVFRLDLHEHPGKTSFTVKDSKSNDRKYIRWGEFRFEIGGEKCTLRAYKSDPAEERLFVPFRDLTSGTETYGAGRYLDLEPGECFSDGKWTLDFNLAYNPYCAYSHRYACPLVPSENWLKVRIEAGEKSFHK